MLEGLLNETNRDTKRDPALGAIEAVSLRFPAFTLPAVLPASASSISALLEAQHSQLTDAANLALQEAVSRVERQAQTATARNRPPCIGSCNSMWLRSLQRSRRQRAALYRSSSRTSLMLFLHVAFWRMVFCGCAVGTAPSTSSSHFRARGEGFALRAALVACQRLLPTWWITSYRRCRCDSGFFRCRFHFAYFWLRSLS